MIRRCSATSSPIWTTTTNKNTGQVPIFRSREGVTNGAATKGINHGGSGVDGSTSAWHAALEIGALVNRADDAGCRIAAATEQCEGLDGGAGSARCRRAKFAVWLRSRAIRLPTSRAHACEVRDEGARSSATSSRSALRLT